MFRFLVFIVAYFYAFECVYAQLPQYQGGYNPNQSLQEYFAAEDQNYDKSIIYVFYNNDYCYGCPQAMEMLEQLYQKKYADEYSLFMINYQDDDEYNFIATYSLSQPLEVVLVKIEDGNSLGFVKIENLQNLISDKTSFDEYVSYRIDSFLNRY